MPSSACKTCALRSEEHTSELQSHDNIVCRLLLENRTGCRAFPFTTHPVPSKISITSAKSYRVGGMMNFFNDPATTEIYPLSLHDALPIYRAGMDGETKMNSNGRVRDGEPNVANSSIDRKSTRLNSSHTIISYAVFCL